MIDGGGSNRVESSPYHSIAAMKEYFDRSTRCSRKKTPTIARLQGMFTAAQQIAHAAQTVEWFVDGAFAASGFDMDFERLR